MNIKKWEKLRTIHNKLQKLREDNTFQKILSDILKFEACVWDLMMEELPPSILKRKKIQEEK